MAEAQAQAPVQVTVTLAARTLPSLDPNAPATVQAGRVIEFEHVAGINPTPVGLLIVNHEGRISGYFPYDVIESVVSKALDVAPTVESLIERAFLMPGSSKQLN